MSKTAIFGVGAIGGYLAAQMLDQNLETLLFARPERAAKLRANGISTTEEIHISGNDLDVTSDANNLSEVDRVLLAVKATSLEAVIPVLRESIPQSTPVFCLANGVRPVRNLKAALPDHNILAGMVPFNVVERENGILHRSSSGEVVVQQGDPGRELQKLMAGTLSPIILASNMDAVQYGKLLLNLNNPVNALSGLPLKSQLSNWHFRRVYALAFKEALRVYKIAKVQHMQAAALPAERIARVLMWPDFLFKLLALPRQDLDPEANTSMAQDLSAGRKTEIEDLNGEIVRIAQEVQTSAPINTKLVKLIHQAEAGERRNWSGPDLLEAVQRHD